MVMLYDQPQHRRIKFQFTDHKQHKCESGGLGVYADRAGCEGPTGRGGRLHLEVSSSDWFLVPATKFTAVTQ